MEKFGTLDSSEKTIAIRGIRWWAQTAKQEGDETNKKKVMYGKNGMGAQMLGVYLGLGTVSHLERTAWSLVK